MAGSWFEWSKWEPRIANWSSIASIALPVIGFVVLTFLDSSAKELVYAGTLSFGLVAAITTFILLSVKLQRRARYVQAIPKIHDALQKILDENEASNHTLLDKKRVLAQAMDDLAMAFSIVTSSPCRSCVKALSIEGKAVFVETFCRNSGHSEDNSKHRIEHNTDFNQLFQNPEMKWFFANNLTHLAGRGEYNNTAPDWATRYRSTVVWPIRLKRVVKDGPNLLGFVCVDSRRNAPFSAEYDHPFGALVADALCPFMMAIAKLLEPSNDRVEENVVEIEPDVRRAASPEKPVSRKTRGRSV
jgi:hypothetical protein